jgi:hypothetical protein
MTLMVMADFRLFICVSDGGAGNSASQTRYLAASGLLSQAEKYTSGLIENHYLQINHLTVQ